MNTLTHQVQNPRDSEGRALSQGGKEPSGEFQVTDELAESLSVGGTGVGAPRVSGGIQEESLGPCLWRLIYVTVSNV